MKATNVRLGLAVQCKETGRQGVVVSCPIIFKRPGTSPDYPLDKDGDAWIRFENETGAPRCREVKNIRRLEK